MFFDFGRIHSYSPTLETGSISCTFSDKYSFVHFDSSTMKYFPHDWEVGMVRGKKVPQAWVIYIASETNAKARVEMLWSNPKEMPPQYKEHLNAVSEKLIYIWQDFDEAEVERVTSIAEILLGRAKLSELNSKFSARRKRLTLKRKRLNNLIRFCRERKYKLTKQELEEISYLLDCLDNEYAGQVERSEQISKYIIDHNLQSKCQNLSGNLTMSQDGEEWCYSGALSPKFYSLLCEFLELKKLRKNARPIKFRSYKEIWEESTEV
jgi:hypothetical protein